MAPEIVSGSLVVQDSTKKITRITLESDEEPTFDSQLRLNRNSVRIHDSDFGVKASISFGSDGGKFYLTTNTGTQTINLLGGQGLIAMRNERGLESIFLNSFNNSIALKSRAGGNSIVLDGNKGDIMLYDEKGFHSFSLHGDVGGYTGLWLGANAGEGPKAGYMAIRGSAGDNSIELDGRSGDIVLNNADCAEDFDISNSEDVEPGTVMIIEGEDMLSKCTAEYDKRVAGVVSGAGDCKPALVLNKRKSKDNRKPLALMGKVFCKTEATRARVEVGDLLTTSSIQGYAMKATDPVRAFGAVIGKALRPLKTGKGLIPILVTLQ